MKRNKISVGATCDRCGKALKGPVTWLLHSRADGKYYPEGRVPEGHIVDAVPFGPGCAERQLQSQAPRFDDLTEQRLKAAGFTEVENEPGLYALKLPGRKDDAGNPPALVVKGFSEALIYDGFLTHLRHVTRMSQVLRIYEALTW